MRQLLCLGSVFVASGGMGGMDSLLAATAGAPAKDYLIHVWRSEQGLPQNSVVCLAQTPDGYLWIGTRSAGLARFDGVRYVRFSPQNTPELRDVEIDRLAVDSQGTLWITTGNESIASYRRGQYKLLRTPRFTPRWRPARLVASYPESVVFTATGPGLYRLPRQGPSDVPERFLLQPPVHARPKTFCQDLEGVLWYLSRHRGLARWIDGQSTEVSAPALGLEGPLHALTTDAQGGVWIASANRLARWRGRAFEDCTPAQEPPPRGIQQLVPAGDGGMWVVERNRLRKWLGGRWVAEAPDVNTLLTKSIPGARWFGDADGGLWVIEEGHGLWHVKANGESRVLTEAMGLPSRFLTCWLQDREGNVWIGTLDSGLARIRERVFHVIEERDGVPGKAVQSVCEDAAGRLWVGTAPGGLARQEAHRFVPLTIPPDSGDPIQHVTVFPEPDGGLWIGSRLGGVWHWRDEQWARPFPLQALSYNSARVLYRDRSGRLWIGNGGDLYSWQDNQLVRWREREGYVGSTAVAAIGEDGGGAVWIGAGPGELWRFQEGGFTRYVRPKAWPSMRFAALLVDRDGVIWVGTLGGGLLRFHNGEFRRISSRQGLPNDFIVQLLEDDLGHLWAGTLGGIFRAAKAELTEVASGQAARVHCSAYGLHEGLPTLECSARFQPACWRSRDGHLWFATVNGLVSVNPRAVKAYYRSPPVLIEEIRVDGVERAFVPNEVVTIEPGRHYVQIRFTGLDFSAPDTVRFRWKLDGAEREWQEGGGQRVVGYGPLPAGRYRFNVLAGNNDGIWAPQPATLAFVVPPKIWETWWLRTVAAAGSLCGLAGVVVVSLRRRYRLKLERLARTEQIERERARIAQDLHDDLGTSLTQISLLSALLERHGTTAEEIAEWARQIRSRSREMVAALNEIVWAVNPKNDSLAEVLGYFGNFTEQFLKPTAIRCRLDFPDPLPEQPLPSDVRHHLFLAFKEALNNAAKHSGASELWVSCRHAGDHVLIQVKDDGRGFNPAPPPTGGNGLANIRLRLEKIGGRCDLRSQPGAGTTLELHLPKP